MADFAANLGGNLLARLSALGTDRRLPLLVTLLMIVLLAQGLANLTWQLLPGQSEEPLVLPRNTASAGPKPATGVDVSAISQWHLFGKVQKVAPKPAAQVTEAPDTRLNLKLRGLLASSDPVAARAIIADGKGREEAYKVGQKLPGNAVLREIYADRVILEYRGRLEALRLPKEAAPSGAVTRSMRQPQTRRPGVTQAGTADNAALLRQYRNALINEPQSLMNLVSASPVTDKATGKLKGYRIRPGKDRKLLGRFGLKSGDVVTAVNGVALDNPIKALEIMRDLSSATSVTLDVERNGVVQSFAFQVE
ncbi:MAG TPA: type II secretion system protein GspC [Gammaproteobacteria bacterium]|nr:type II secretion system protein GspC [Gammaproteobacteria bacterium]